MKPELDTTEADRALAKQAEILDDRAIKRAEVRALNRGARGARTEMSREIRKKVRMKARDVKDAVRIDRASYSSSTPTATLRISEEPVPLVRFGRARQVRKGVAVTIMKGKRQTIPGAFIVDELGGNAFVRKGKARLPIRMLYGPSVRNLAPAALVKARGRIDERVKKELRRNVQREIDKAFKYGRDARFE